ncbi:NHL repeat-containing protein [Sediminispirochaeta bajacaliforniensis]|uniref:NHL repeat-containing protein n=1 Tax=Sediminispirochaeta bajacaliforniensis TaxID=148 RepID=UPI000524AB12|nr:NHL repeat-containing protein [Sediminispirochaeta bajacaliforniensis]
MSRGRYLRCMMLPCLMFLFLTPFLFGQETEQEASPEQKIDMDAVSADEAFMSGVRSYHNGEYASSILSFERSLSFKPDRGITRLWLGNSFYRSGLLASALEQWKTVMDSQAATASLKNLIDSIEYRRALGPALSPESRFVEVDRLEGSADEYTLFLGPTSILPRADGGSYVVSFASNEVVSLSINGMIRTRIRGGLNGLNRPFDALVGPSGRLYISEYQGDRIVSCTPSGTDIHRFGGKGREDGKLLGPQYLAMDREGYLYVSEQGNRRISKFDTDGNFILSFGKRAGDFPGFREPTGICVVDDTLFIADGRRNILYRFDVSGNFLGTCGENLFSEPEGLTLAEDGKLLVADATGLHLFDTEREVSKTLIAAGEGDSFIKGAFDVNGNLMISDFSANAVCRYADFNQLYGSLLVDVERIIENRFPRIVLELSVSRRDGKPVVGLEETNFLVTEGRVEASGMHYLGSVDDLDQAAVAIVAERSDAGRNFSSAFGEAVGSLANGAAGRFEFSFVSAGPLPVREVSSVYGADPLVEALLSGSGEAGRQWQCDSAIRLAASGLTAKNKKRAIIFLAGGPPPASAFDRHELAEVARYLEVNHIGFFCVYPFDGDVPDEYRYLAEKSGGRVIHLFRPEGIASLVDIILQRRDGRYLIEYNSSLDDDFGRKFLPVEVQAYLHGRSGRGESGYFAPLR